MKHFKAPLCELEIAEGLPGHGKSLYGTERTLHAMMEQRRPVFTSLPIKWPVMREYLRIKGGPELAGLLFEVDEPHFRAFIKRAADWQRFRARYQRRRESRRFDATLRKQFDAEFGPPIIAPTKENGYADPNWISPFSLIILDEIHHWFPQKGQAHEDPDLLTYLTMHRHFMHSILAMSQDRMQISISFRRLAAAYWTVRDRGKDKLLFGVRLKHLGVQATGYAKFTPDQEASGLKLEDQTPIESFTRFRQLPNVRFMFRLYESYTHAGSAEAMKQEMRAVRRAAGLTDEGELCFQPPIEQAKRMSKKLLASVACTSLVFGVMAGVVIRPDRPTPPPEPIDTQAPAAPVFDTWPRWSSLRDGQVRFDGQPLNVGASHNGISLQYASRRDRLCVLARGGHIWVWHYGQPSPTRLGEPGKVLNELRVILGDLRPDRRGGVSAEPSRPAGTVEPSPG